MTPVLSSPKRTVRRSRSPSRPTPDAFSLPTLVHTLENGLTIIVREDSSSPVVAVQAWCRTGSIHEGRWLGAGLSHVLEHMLFKGTTSRTGPRIDQEVQEAGGQLNAYTSFDRTVYWINIPSQGSRVGLDILSDIMQHATLPPAELERELEVIRREMDMNHDDPGRRSGRRLFESAYTRSPYRYTVIGYPNLFGQLRAEDIRAYYQDRYIPNNTFFVVVGDVQAGKVVEQLSDAYSGSPARPLPLLYLPAEPRQTAPRRVVEEAAIALGHLHTGWHVPDIRHPDIPAIDVLATVLGGGRSSRLHQTVRERLGLVHSVDAWLYCPGLSGLFGVSAVLDGPRYEPAHRAIESEIDRLKRGRVSRAELQKAARQFTTATLGARKTMQGQAQDLGGSWLAADDLAFSDRYLERVRRLTTADLVRVANEYLTESNSTHYALLPTNTAPKRPARAPRPAAIAPTLWRLDNGLRVVFRQDHRLPFVDMRLVLLGGVLQESESDNGLTALLARTWIKGTRRRSAEDIAREIEAVGGHLDPYSGSQSFGLQLEVLRPEFQLGLDLFADIVLQPAFPVAEVSRERDIQLAAIRAQQDQALQSAARLMRSHLFGPQGYGLDPLGTESTVGRLKRNTLRRAHQNWVRPDRAVLALVGDVEPGPARRALERAFRSWCSGDAVPPQTTTPGLAHVAAHGLRRVRESRDKRQATVVVGFPGTSLRHPDRFALELLQETCSDLGSRLFRRVRDELGLAYYVGAFHMAGLRPGYFALYAGTAPSTADQVESELLREAEALATGGLTEEELRRAQAKILGHKKIARQDPASLGLALALDELFGLGYNYSTEEDARLQAVTIEELRQVARRYLSAESAVVARIEGRESAA